MKEDSGTNPTSNAGGDDALIGTWVSGSMNGDTFVSDGANADTIVVTAEAFLDGFSDIPQTASCELVIENGKIGQSCNGNPTFIYDYLIEGNILYLESNWLETPDGQVVKADCSVYQKL